jgi:hypothetical protein
MPYSYNVYTGNGSTTQFTIGFPYIRREHVKVYVAYVDTAYTYVNNTTVQLATAPGAGVRVEVRRVTPVASVLVDFADGSTLVAADLDASNLQHLYIEQELDDYSKQTISIDPATGLLTASGQRITNVGDPVNAQDVATKTYVDTTTVASAGDAMTGPLAMGNNKITGLALPTADTDAVNRGYVNSIVANGIGDGDKGDIVVSGSGSVLSIDAGVINDADVNASAGIVASKLSFTQAGSGATARTIDSKLKDVVSVKDFDAVGDGVTNDTAAIQAALDSVPNGANSYAPSKVSGGAGRVSLFFPPGDYVVTAPLDMSQRDYTRLVADGRATIFSSSTSYIIDMASADHCEIDGLALYSATARVGIYINRCTSNPYAMFNTIRNVAITLTPDVTANSGNGRIGIYNNRGEQNVFENLVLRCDIPYLAQNASDSNFPPTSGTQDTSIASATVNTHIQCNFIANGTHAPGVILKNVISFEFLNCYWGRAALTSGSLNYAVYAENINRCTFTGSNEVFARFMLVIGSLYSIYANIIMDVPYLDTGGVFNLDSAGNNGVLDSHIRVLVAGGTPAVGACIFKDSGSATQIQILGNLIETTSLMIPITTVGGRLIGKNIIKTDFELSLSDAVLTSASSASLTVTGGSINNVPIGATTASTGVFTTITAYTSATVGNSYSSAFIATSGFEDSFTRYRGTPDGVGFFHSKSYGGRDTEDGFNYGSYVSLHTEGKGSGTTDTSTEKVRCTANGHLRPIGDNTQSLGKSGSRWSVVYAGTGTINTSDANEKQQIAELSEAEQTVAAAIKGLIRKFKFNDAVAVKGDNARIHVGVIAQDVEQAFIDEGLDPANYGLFCRDEWWEIDGQPVAATDDGSVISIWHELNGEVVYLDENGKFPDGAKQISKTTQAIKRIRLGIRYEELLAFVIAAF